VKARREGDRLKVGSDAGLRRIGYGAACGVRIGSGDGRMLPNIQTFDCLLKRESGIEIGVLRVVAIPAPKAGVYGELGEVGKPSLSGGPVAVLPGNVRKWGPLRRSISAVEAPLEAM
jgi:hypothetical protein